MGMPTTYTLHADLNTIFGYFSKLVVGFTGEFGDGPQQQKSYWGPVPSVPSGGYAPAFTASLLVLRHF